MISLNKQTISELIYKINFNNKEFNCIDIHIYHTMHHVFDMIEEIEEYNNNVEIKKILVYIKRHFNKYTRCFDSYNFKSYNYDEIIKVLEDIDNKLNYVM